MNCTEVRGYLSEYMDEMLDERMKDLVEKHLTTCKACRQELASLRSVAGELREEGRLKAPEDFLETLHERLSRDTWWTRMKKTLFVPAQIKIPLEFATACVAAVIIFSLYSTVSPDRQQVSSMQDLALEDSGRSTGLLEASPEAPARSRQPLAAPAGIPGDKAPARPEPVELALVLPSPLRAGDMGAVPDEQEVSAAKGSFEVTGNELSPPALPAMKGAAPASRDSAAEGTLEKSKEDTTGPAAEKDRPKGVEDQDDANGARVIIQRIEDAIGLCGGKILSEKLDVENPEELIILGEIPAGRYGDLYGHLARLAQVQGPALITRESPQDMIRVRIRLR